MADLVADLVDRPAGFAALAGEWRACLGAGSGLHPISRAAFAFHAWRALGLSGRAAVIEGAVVAARIGAAELRGGAGFVPLALAGAGAGAGGGALHTGGDPAARLAAWYKAVEAAALGGLMEADRLQAWHRRAGAAALPLTGRTPPRLIAALAAWPLASAPMLEAETGASRAAVQRNMAAFETLGLVREVTGQDRFRFWAAAI